jgi:hypothetical protein
MLEIEEAIVARVSNDAQIQTIMGGTAADRRIYAWFPIGDIVFVEGTVECSIIYRTAVVGYPWRWSYPNQGSDEQLFFRIAAINQLKLGQVSERLIDLFDKGSLQTTNWSVRWIEIVSSVEGLNEGEATKPIHIRNQSYRFGTVLRR